MGLVVMGLVVTEMVSNGTYWFDDDIKRGYRVNTHKTHKNSRAKFSCGVGWVCRRRCLNR